MKSLQTEILIQAPKEAVWNTLMDFEQYPKWNPFIVSLEGKAQVGEKLQVSLKSQASGKLSRFSPKVKRCETAQAFSWLGHLGIPGLFDGRHRFELIAEGPQRTRLIHGEEFRGLLVGLIMRQIGDDVKNGFQAMNQALKERVETQLAPSV